MGPVTATMVTMNYVKSREVDAVASSDDLRGCAYKQLSSLIPRCFYVVTINANFTLKSVAMMSLHYTSESAAESRIPNVCPRNVIDTLQQ